MKKIAIILVMLGLVTSPLFAAAITDSVKPLGHMKWSLGVEDNFVVERDIEKGSTDTKFDLEDVNQVYAKLSLGLTPYFNIYTKLGGSTGGDIKRVNTVAHKTDIETEYGFLAGGGISFAKEVYDEWKLGLDTQFNWTKMDVDKVTYDSASTTGVSGEIVNWEVQGTPFVTRRFEIPQYNLAASPYVGVKVSYFKTKTDGQIKFKDSAAVAQTSSWTLKGDDIVGVVVGSDLEVTKNLTLQLEGRFVDETAVSGGATYKF